MAQIDVGSEDRSPASFEVVAHVLTQVSAWLADELGPALELVPGLVEPELVEPELVELAPGPVVVHAQVSKLAVSQDEPLVQPSANAGKQHLAFVGLTDFDGCWSPA